MKNALITLALLFSASAFAQVGIGTTDPQATLHVVDTGSQFAGIIFPVVTELVATPETPQGLTVFYNGVESQGQKRGLYIFVDGQFSRLLTNR